MTWSDESYKISIAIQDSARVFRWWCEESIKRQERIAAALERILTKREEVNNNG